MSGGAPRVAVHPTHGPVTRIGEEQRDGVTLWRYRCTIGELDVLLPTERLGTLRAPIHRSDLDHIAAILATPRPRYASDFQRRRQNAMDFAVDVASPTSGQSNVVRSSGAGS